jgi:hypothetical protein
VSGNWAGYAVTGKAATSAFTHVSGSWVVPRVACGGRGPAYSVAWVGLGGFADGEAALEQIGTEANCTPAGRATSSAWYEILPAPPVRVRLHVRAGDRVRASIGVRGMRVSLLIENRTRHTAYARELRVESPGLSSAEWIVEAPSACTRDGRCRPLPLANFGTTAFSNAVARAGRHSGSITDDAWTATAIELGIGDPAAVYFASRPWQARGVPASTAPRAGASPAPLSDDGASFTVTWRGPARMQPAPHRPPGPYAP